MALEFIPTLIESPYYITKVESLALKKVENITLCGPLRELPYNSIIEQDCKLNAKLTVAWNISTSRVTCQTFYVLRQ